MLPSGIGGSEELMLSVIMEKTPLLTLSSGWAVGFVKKPQDRQPQSLATAIERARPEGTTIQKTRW